MSYGRATGQTDFNSGEYRTTSAPRTGGSLITLTLPLDLTFRTLWGLHVAVNVGSDWCIVARIVMTLAGGTVAELPFCAGNSTAGAATVLPRSLPCVLVPGTGPVGRTLFLAVANPLTGPPAEAQSYYLQPYDMEIMADTMSLIIDFVSNVSALHTFMACQSTVSPNPVS